MSNRLRNYQKFLEYKKVPEIPDGLPQEVSESALIIARGLYDKVRRPDFYEMDGKFYIRFGVTELDFEYINTEQSLPLDMSPGSMSKRKYYVELIYDDQYPSDNSVSYEIFYEPMGSSRIKGEPKEEEFVDEYEQSLKDEIEDNVDMDDLDMGDFE